MKVITVTQLQISSRTGSNGEPAGGYVTFSDGGSYGFSCRMEQADDGSWIRSGYFFLGSRKRAHGGYERFMFESAKREALLVAALNK